MKRIRMDRALERYLRQEFTLCSAAEYAGVSIYEVSEKPRNAASRISDTPPTDSHAA